MNDFFKQRNATELPFVEVYVGPTKVDALVMYPERNFRAPLESEAPRAPPDLLSLGGCVILLLPRTSGFTRLSPPASLPPVAGLQTSLAAAQRLRREAQWQSTSAKWLRERDALYALLGRARERLATERGALSELLQLRADEQRGRGGGAHPTERPPRSPPRGGAPMRGATGGRRKGFRGG